MAENWQLLNMTLLARLNRFPPAAVRIVAHRGLRVTREMIAQQTGWSVRKVTRVSNLLRWDTLTLAEADAFARACGLELGRFKRAIEYMKRGSIHSHRAWEDTAGPMVRRILRRLADRDQRQSGRCQ